MKLTEKRNNTGFHKRISIQDVATIYVNTTMEFWKIKNGLMDFWHIKDALINERRITLPIYKDVKNQTLQLGNINYELDRNPEIVKEVLSEYLHREIDAYKIKYEQIQQLIAEENPDNRQAILDSLIKDIKEDNKQEIITSIANSYDIKNQLINYSEDQASAEQKQAWLTRNSIIENYVAISLKELEEKKEELYLAIINIHDNPQKILQEVLEIRTQVLQRWYEDNNSHFKSLSNLKLQPTELIENYILVEKGILTQEEAGLFHYHEHYVYAIYYHEMENNIKDIFELAKKCYAESKDQGLKDLAEISHEKIPSILSLVTNIKDEEVSFKEIAEFTIKEVNVLSTNNELLKILPPKDVINMVTALRNNDTDTIQEIIMIIPANKIGLALQLAINKSDYLKNTIFEMLKIHLSEHNNEHIIKNIVNTMPNSYMADLYKWAIDNNRPDIASLSLLEHSNEHIIDIIINSLPEQYIGALLEYMIDIGRFDIVNRTLSKDRNEQVMQNIIDSLPEQYIGALLKYMIGIGRFDIVKRTLSKDRNEQVMQNIINTMPKSHLVILLERMIDIGHLDILVKLILEKIGSDIPAYRKGNALLKAICHGFYNIAKLILEMVGGDITLGIKGKALLNAISKGSYKLVKLILKMVGDDITQEIKVKAIQEAAEKDHLEQLEDYVSAEEKGKALLEATTNGKIEAVERILVKDKQINPYESYLLLMGPLGNNQISSKYKEDALNIAKEKQDQNMIDVLKKYQDTDLARDLISTLGKWCMRIIGGGANIHTTNSLAVASKPADLCNALKGEEVKNTIHPTMQKLNDQGIRSDFNIGTYVWQERLSNERADSKQTGWAHSVRNQRQNMSKENQNIPGFNLG